jgi:hypothetical protein
MAHRMTINEPLEVPGTMDESLDREVAAQSTNSSVAGTSVTVHNCDRLLRHANPPGPGVAFRDWLLGAMRQRRR